MVSGSKGRTLITGASTGIGRALAEVFAGHGHDLILVARNREKLQVCAIELEQKHKVKVAWFTEDLADPGGPARVHRCVSAEGLEVEILVNNAGIGLYGQFVNTEMTAELKMIQLNVAAVVELTKRFLPGMVQKQYGRILNVASTAAFVPGPWMSVYYATKAFVLSFSQAIAYELRAKGVTVTTLCPGPTESEFQVRSGSQRSQLFESFLMDAPTVARAGYDGTMKGQTLVIPGLRNKLIPVAARLIPRPMMAALSHRAARPSEK